MCCLFVVSLMLVCVFVSCFGLFVGDSFVRCFCVVCLFAGDLLLVVLFAGDLFVFVCVCCCLVCLSVCPLACVENGTLHYHCQRHSLTENDNNLRIAIVINSMPTTQAMNTNSDNHANNMTRITSTMTMT